MAEESKTTQGSEMMSEETQGMKPIWYFVGLILLLVGIVLIVTGIYNYYNPAQSGTVLEYLHPDIWWGGIMTITGIVFVFFTRNSTVE